MNQFTQPTKEQVRTWLQDRQAHPAPLPDRDAIRRALGWGFTSQSTDRRSF